MSAEFLLTSISLYNIKGGKTDYSVGRKDYYVSTKSLDYRS